MNSRISDNHHTLNTPNTTEPTPIQELSWHGLQDWICGVGVAWTQAEGWHLIDWGDGTTTPAHPDMPSRQHIYGGACDNTTYTISARNLNRDGTTGPTAAQTTVQTRGRGNPGHNFYLHADERTITLTLGPEKPWAHTIDWGDGTPPQHLDEGTRTATHTYTTTEPFTPWVGIYDRPARRLRWFQTPTLNITEKHRKDSSMANMHAQFIPHASWHGGYSASYRITNTATSGDPSTWEMSFVLDSPAHIADLWGAGTPKGAPQSNARSSTAAEPHNPHTEPALAVYRKTGNTYVIVCNTPLAPGAHVDVGFRVEPAGEPAKLPHSCSINGAACAADHTPPPTPPGHDDTEPPTTPTGVHTTSTGPHTLTLAWTPSTDDTGVAAYEIDVDGDINTHVPAPATSGVASNLDPATTYEVRVRAKDRAGNLSLWSDAINATTSQQSAPGHAWGVPFAPYVDVTLWPTPDLAKFHDESGASGFTLAFVNNNNWDLTKLDPCWGGYPDYSVSKSWGKDNIDALKAKGATPIISFGGESGTEIAAVAKDVKELTDAYAHIIDTYGVDHVDFDIEGHAQNDLPSLERRSAAIAALQKIKPNLKVSFTLPVLPEGLVADGLRVLRSAATHGVQISLVNIMAMVFYRQEDMGLLVRQAAEATHTQLEEFFPNETAHQRWGRLGVCPMIGMNNDKAIFTLEHAEEFAQFATGHGMGSLTYWEANRDRNACLSEALYQCTNVPQEPWDYARRFATHQTAQGKKKAA